MTIFLDLIPSGRTYTPPSFPHAALRAMGGGQTQVRHSNAQPVAKLQLTFIALSTANLQLLQAHFIAVGGGFTPFTLPVETWAGTSDATPPGSVWRYADKPQVTDVGCGLHDVVISLESLPEAPPD